MSLDRLERFAAHLEDARVEGHSAATWAVEEIKRLRAALIEQRDWFADVLEFHRKLAPSIVKPLPCVPELRGKTDFCVGFIEEEFEETRVAMSQGDLPEVADGLTDLIVVTIRAALIWGIDLRPVWDEVHRANMTKEGGETRADSKVMKPAGRTPPDVKGVLERQQPIA